MRKPVLAVIGVLVVVAVAVWWRMRPTSRAAAPAAKVTTIAPARGSADRGAEREAPLPVLVDDDPRGDLRLEGQVVDTEDHPVTGATVTLASNPPRTATTEADGGFAFDALVGRPYTLVARAPHGIAGPVTARLTAKSEPIVLHLRPAATVTITVESIDHKPIDGATVELRGVDHQQELTKGGTATFAAIPGGYQVAAWVATLAHATTWIQVGAGDTTAKLVLVPGAGVAGKVIDDHGAPVAGARVTYHGASDWSQQADERYDAAVTGADGAFRFAAMAAGSFRFAAANADMAPGISGLITLDGKTERTGVTITLAAGATVRGHVVDTAKQPVVAARVRIGISSKRGMIFDSPRQVYSDAKGAFEIKGLARRELAAVAMHESGASQTQQLDTTRGDVGDVTLVIDVTGVISGIVVDSTGQPVEGAQVSAAPDFRDQKAMSDFTQFRLRGFPQELTDAGGKFTLTGLEPGSYQINAGRTRAGFNGGGFGGRGPNEATYAVTGTKDLRLVLQPEGGVKGKVLLADGSTPIAFTISLGAVDQAFTGTSSFEVDTLAPQSYELQVRGPTFQSRAVEVLVEPGKIADVGTITVQKGRTLAGTVVANGAPVPNATVYAGRQLFGNGSSNTANFGPMGQGTKQTTTAADGSFSLAGFSDGDLAITAEQADLGRSKALRIPTDLPNQSDLVLELQPFGALSGVLRAGGKPAEGVFVSCQSTTTPGAIYAVASGADGSYRYDKLAPDTYKVSATIGMPMVGMRFYSQEVNVPSGKEVTVDLTVDPGSVTLNVVAAPRSGTLGVASVWVTSGTLVARTATDLSVRMASSGAGASQWVIIRAGEPAAFPELTPGSYTACVVPFPVQVQGMSVMGYVERHGDSLPAFCQPVMVAPTPDTQTATVQVDLPPYVPDPGSGSGSGS